MLHPTPVKRAPIPSPQAVPSEIEPLPRPLQHSHRYRLWWKWESKSNPSQHPKRGQCGRRRRTPDSCHRLSSSPCEAFLGWIFTARAPPPRARFSWRRKVFENRIERKKENKIRHGENGNGGREEVKALEKRNALSRENQGITVNIPQKMTKMKNQVEKKRKKKNSTSGFSTGSISCLTVVHTSTKIQF